MSLFDFVVVLLASSQLVDIWFNASLLAWLRAYAQAREDSIHLTDLAATSPFEEPGRFTEGHTEGIWAAMLDAFCPNWVFRLLNCDYCLSHHTPWMIAGAFYLPTLVLPAGVAFMVQMPVYVLAITRAALLLNAVLPASAKYRREEFLNTEDPDDEEGGEAENDDPSEAPSQDDENDAG